MQADKYGTAMQELGVAVCRMSSPGVTQLEIVDITLGHISAEGIRMPSNVKPRLRQWIYAMFSSDCNAQ